MGSARASSMAAWIEVSKFLDLDRNGPGLLVE